jgi:hypothetical protein
MSGEEIDRRVACSVPAGRDSAEDLPLGRCGVKRERRG